MAVFPFKGRSMNGSRFPSRTVVPAAYNHTRLDDLIMSEGASSAPYQPVLTVSPEIGKRELRFGIIVGNCFFSGTDHRLSSQGAAQRTPTELLDDPGNVTIYTPCVLPVYGFHAIRTQVDGSQQPYWFCPASQGVVNIAGFVDRSEIGDVADLSVWMLYVSPPTVLKPFFQSFPAIVDSFTITAWLTADLRSGAACAELLVPLRSVELKFWSSTPSEQAAPEGARK